jgi:hypothetical protein
MQLAENHLPVLTCFSCGFSQGSHFVQGFVGTINYSNTIKSASCQNTTDLTLITPSSRIHDNKKK